MTPNDNIKPKQTYCDSSHSSTPKHAKVTGGQKLVEFIHVVEEKLRFSSERKTKPTERAIKQLVELYKSNSRLLIGGLTLL